MNGTKEQILLTALELFSQRGFDAVSVSDIAGKLGITKGALYRHYTSKQDIFEKILARMYRIDAQRAQQFRLPEKLFADSPESYCQVCWDSIAGFTIAQFHFWTEDSFAASFRRMLTIEQFRTPELAALYTGRFVNRMTDYHRKLFHRLIASGVLIDADPALLSLAYVSPILVLLGICDRQPELEESCIEKLRAHVRLFYHTYNRKKREENP